MEYVHGHSLSNLDLKMHHDIPSRVAKILAHLGQMIVPAPIPGLIGDREPLGYLIGDGGAKVIFTSIEDMNSYMNKRLQYRNDFINLTPYALVLCHGTSAGEDFEAHVPDSIRPLCSMSRTAAR